MLKRNYSDILRNRIMSLCDERGWKINTLARMSGLNQSTLENISLGITKNPSVITLHKISLGFGMTLSEFLDFDELNDYSFDD